MYTQLQLDSKLKKMIMTRRVVEQLKKDNEHYMPAVSKALGEKTAFFIDFGLRFLGTVILGDAIRLLEMYPGYNLAQAIKAPQSSVDDEYEEEQLDEMRRHSEWLSKTLPSQFYPEYDFATIWRLHTIAEKLYLDADEGRLLDVPPTPAKQLVLYLAERTIWDFPDMIFDDFRIEEPGDAEEEPGDSMWYSTQTIDGLNHLKEDIQSPAGRKRLLEYIEALEKALWDDGFYEYRAYDDEDDEEDEFEDIDYTIKTRPDDPDGDAEVIFVEGEIWRKLTSPLVRAALWENNEKYYLTENDPMHVSHWFDPLPEYML